MKFSCSLPVDDIGEDDGFLSFDAIGEMARAVDKAGLDAIFVTDHPAPSGRWVENGGHATLDPFVALAAVAAANPRLYLLTHILVLAYRNPFVVAKAAASLDRLSGGRLILGVGTGYLRPEYAAVGVPFEERGPITEESLRVLRQAWTGEPVQYKGARFEARDATVRPRPTNGDIPIWGGGNAPVAIRRAVELCDGWCPFPAEGVLSQTARTDELATLDQLKEKIAYAQDHAEKIGRTKPLSVCIGRLGHPKVTPGVPADAARAIDDYAGLAEAGVSWTTVALPSPSRQAFIENVQWFGEEVAAKLGASAEAA